MAKGIGVHPAGSASTNGAGVRDCPRGKSLLSQAVVIGADHVPAGLDSTCR